MSSKSFKNLHASNSPFLFNLKASCLECLRERSIRILAVEETKKTTLFTHFRTRVFTFQTEVYPYYHSLSHNTLSSNFFLHRLQNRTFFLINFRKELFCRRRPSLLVSLIQKNGTQEIARFIYSFLLPGEGFLIFQAVKIVPTKSCERRSKGLIPSIWRVTQDF